MKSIEEPIFVFKNNKEACKFLNIEYKDSTNSRRFQEKQFNLHWKKWIKQGRKILVYQEKETISDAYEKGNNIYNKYIVNILIDYFYNHKDNILYKTKNNLAETTGIINHNYISLKNDVTQSKYGYIVTKDVLDSINGIIYSSIFSVLNKLNKKNYITYNQTYAINFINKNNMTEFRESTIFEAAIIKKIEYETLKSMRIENIRLIQNSKKLSKYYTKTNELVKLKINDMESYYTVFKLAIFKNNISTVKFNISELKAKLNKIIIDRLNNKIKKKQEKVKQKLKFCLNRWDKDRLSDTYLNESEELIKHLVEIN